VMSHMPDISVIVCTHNHGKWIERCVRSLVHQVYIDSDFEIIIVNDGSTDNTDDVLKNIDIDTLKIIKNDSTIGLPKSLNMAIRKALGRYIVRVDSDDYVARNFLYLTKTFLDMNREYQAVATDYVVVDQFENFIRRANCFEEEIACGVMFRKECLFDIGLYDDAFTMREGHELRSRFLEKFKMARLEFPLYKYRDHAENRTKNKDELDKYDQMLKEKE